jgi:hypothetical protein
MDPTSCGQGAILRSHSTLVLHVSESAFVSRKKLKTPGSEKRAKKKKIFTPIPSLAIKVTLLLPTLLTILPVRFHLFHPATPSPL